MVTDAQVRILMKALQTEETLTVAAAKAGMDRSTARKYRDAGCMPSEMKAPRQWRTRQDPFSGVWDEVRGHLEVNPGLEAKTLFDYLQRQYPGRFQDGQLRTLQRRIKQWRALEGPAKEVYFPQRHAPGELAQSDFTHMGSLNVTIQGAPFDHLIYHFVLTYSNWETASICFSESFESLSEGLQNALWRLGGVPHAHQTDCLTSAVQKLDHPDDFTQRYQGLLAHYGLEGRKTQPVSPHENGDVEQRHHRFRRAVDQALMLRGHRDFENREAYVTFLRGLEEQLNRGRSERFQEELAVLRRLPRRRLEACRRLKVRVGPASTIRVAKNVYSVHSRLIGERVDVRLFAEHLDVHYAQKRVEHLPRLRGEGRHFIQYRHVIDWLQRKPGAFANYRYRPDLYPTSRFRRACDLLEARHTPRRAHRLYLELLALAAREGEDRVDRALESVLDGGELTLEAVSAYLPQAEPTHGDVEVAPVELRCYDALLTDTPADGRDLVYEEAAG